MRNLAKIKRLYLWKPSICKTFWTTLVHVRTRKRLLYIHVHVRTRKVQSKEK